VAAGEAWQEKARRALAKRNSGQKLSRCLAWLLASLDAALEQLAQLADAAASPDSDPRPGVNPGAEPAPHDPADSGSPNAGAGSLDDARAWSPAAASSPLEERGPAAGRKRGRSSRSSGRADADADDARRQAGRGSRRRGPSGGDADERARGGSRASGGSHPPSAEPGGAGGEDGPGGEHYVENERELFCVCQQPYNVDTAMISCDACAEWYHLRCVGLTQATARTLRRYACPLCAALRGEPHQLDAAVGRTRRTRRAPAPAPRPARARLARCTACWMSSFFFPEQNFLAR
jgi:hypothetical protein